MKFNELQISKFTKAIMFVFIMFAFATLLIPFVCMSFAKTDYLSGSTDLAAEPKLISDEGNLNTNILSDFGKYFEDHFAFRPQLVTINALIHYTFFNDTATNQVIAGKDGYMFYSATLNDYLGKDQLSDNQLQAIAYNLSLVQQTLEEANSSFCFMISPNKNSLYANFMPDYYLKGYTKHNSQRLIPFLQEYNVNYCDLFEVFEGQNTDQLYLKTDSHWNNKGALYAANKILEYCNKDKITATEWQVRDDFDGDLFAMTFPCIVGSEQQYYLDGYNNIPNINGNYWKYMIGSSVEDNLVSTKSNISKNESSLYMYRDSFANALIPYLGSAFSNATFSKMIPYDITEALVEKPKNVIIERSERQLNYLAQTAPIMAAPICNNDKYARNITDATSNITLQTDINLTNNVSIEQDGNMIKIQGDYCGDIAHNQSMVLKVADENTGHITLYKPFLTYKNESTAESKNSCSKFCARLWNDEIDLNNSKISICLASDSCIISSEVYHSKLIFNS